MSQSSSQPSHWLCMGTGVQFPAVGVIILCHHTCYGSGAHILEDLWLEVERLIMKLWCSRAINI